MNTTEILAKISHYEWMLESLTLNPRHEWWVRGQLEDLTESLKKVSQ